MRIALDTSCLEMVSRSGEKRYPRDPLKCHDKSLIALARPLRSKLLRDLAEQTSDWMLEQRVKAWAYSCQCDVSEVQNTHGVKKCEFVISKDGLKEAVECKRLNSSSSAAQCEIALLKWIEKQLSESHAQLACSIQEGNSQGTVVLDLSAIDSVTNEWSLDSSRPYLISNTEPCPTILDKAIAEAASISDKLGIDSVLIVSDEQLFLNENPVGVRSKTVRCGIGKANSLVENMAWTVLFPLLDEFDKPSPTGMDLQVHLNYRSDAWVDYEILQYGSQKRMWGEWKHVPADPN